MRLIAAIVGGAVFLCSALLSLAPVHAETTPPPPNQKLIRDDALRLLGKVLEHVRMQYIEKPDDNALVAGAISGIQREFPEYAAAGSPPLNGTFYQALNKLGEVAGTVLEHRRADGDKERLVKAAIDGILAGLDPHSSYMDSKSFKALYRGDLGEIGLEVAVEDGFIKVVTPTGDAPAARAGIRAGDIITHVDGEEVRGLSLGQAVEKMRGPVNSRIHLKIVRNGNDAPVEIEIVRENIHINPVRGRIQKDVGIVRITGFEAQAIDQLKNVVAYISAQAPGDKLRGYVIDLRNNPGGLLDQAILVADAFLESGEIVSAQGRDETQRFNARPGDLTKGKPLIVLINGGSAAGSEIVAGALQDNRRATVVGTRSFGRGLIQTIFPLGSGNGALRLTTARYFTPSGRSIQAKGITPDIEVLQDMPEEMKARQVETKGESSLPGHLKAEGDERAGSQSYVPPDDKDDKALKLALDLMRGVKVNPAFPPLPK